VSFATDAKLQAGEFRITAEAVAVKSDKPVPRALERIEEREPAAPEPVHQGEPSLVLISDDQAVRTIPIDRRVRIGRQADNDVVVVDPGVSRHHAEVINENGTCTLHDLGSTNGTYVNGSVVTEHALRPGDRISLGSTVVEFRRD
jgi:pSer/pThr/pTyr-binding forkhead associated (FHA) protein